MKAELKNAAIDVAIVGDGGYQNQSSLTLTVEGLGSMNVSDPWDLSSIKGREILGWSLSIPSGVLTAKSGGIKAEWTDEESVNFTAEEATWDGKQAGLFGGMSGYGNFDYGGITYVVQGTYMLPEDAVRIFGPIQRVPLDFSVDRTNHRVTWAKYALRHSRTLNAVGYDAAHEDAEIAAGVLRTPLAERSPDEEAFLTQWWEGLRLREALTDEEFLVACIAHRAANATLRQELTPDLEEYCKNIHHQLAGVTPLLAACVSVLAADDGQGPSTWIVGGGNVRVAITDQPLLDLLNMGRSQ